MWPRLTTGEMHWRDGWVFSRTDDGSVRIEHRPIDGRVERIAVIPAAEWASIVAHVARTGTDGEAWKFAAAEALHSGTLRRPTHDENGVVL